MMSQSLFSWELLLIIVYLWWQEKKEYIQNMMQVTHESTTRKTWKDWQSMKTWRSWLWEHCDRGSHWEKTESRLKERKKCLSHVWHKSKASVFTWIQCMQIWMKEEERSKDWDVDSGSSHFYSSQRTLKVWISKDCSLAYNEEEGEEEDEEEGKKRW